MFELFDRDGDRLKIKAWLRKGINWRVGDANDPRLAGLLEPQDMVFVNNLLCHMYTLEAELCLRNVVRIVKPGGFIFVSGVDLNLRTKIVRDLNLEAVTDLIEDIHNGDRKLVMDWPFRYWGLEPFTTERQDWEIRYSTVFRVPTSVDITSSQMAAADSATLRWD
jgi:SAM-dependent methyltransferase